MNYNQLSQNILILSYLGCVKTAAGAGSSSRTLCSYLRNLPCCREIETSTCQNETAIKSSSSGKTWIPLRNCWLMRVNRSYTRFNNRYYAKVSHTTKHQILAKQYTVPFLSLFMVQVRKMRSAAYSVEWEAHPSRTIDSSIRDPWTGKFVNLWNCGSRETRESLKITQISVSLFNRPQSHWSDEIEKQSITWKVKSVNGEPFQSIPQFWHLQYTAQITSVPGAKSETCSRQKSV